MLLLCVVAHIIAYNALTTITRAFTAVFRLSLLLAFMLAAISIPARILILSDAAVHTSLQCSIHITRAPLLTTTGILVVIPAQAQSQSHSQSLFQTPTRVSKFAYTCSCTCISSSTGSIAHTFSATFTTVKRFVPPTPLLHTVTNALALLLASKLFIWAAVPDILVFADHWQWSPRHPMLPQPFSTICFCNSSL